MKKDELFKLIEKIKKKDESEYEILCEYVKTLAKSLKINLEHPPKPPIHS